MHIVRISLSSIFAAAVTFGLLVLMYSLIATEEVSLDESGTRKIADISMPNTEIKANIKEAKPDKPEEPEEPPPEVEQPKMEDMAVDTESVNIAVPAAKGDINITSGMGLGASDGEYLPIVKVAPIYPRRAQSRGIEGYCTVEYTVTKAGTVKDVEAVDCNPQGVFERASVKAALKFKYKPRVQNGEPIEVAGVQNRFTYKLEQ